MAENFARADVPDGTRVALSVSNRNLVQKIWLASSVNRLRQHVLRFSLFYQFGLEQNVLSIDGIGAYDHVLRSAVISKLYDVPCLRELLPFVRATRAQPSEYCWEDAGGVRHTIRQAEDGEKGDQLMLLFSMAIH